MADYMQGHIQIGGQLLTQKVQQLWDAIRADDAGPDWGTQFRDLPHLQHHLAGLGDEPLHLYAESAPYGHCRELEAFATRNNLAWVAHSDAKHEYDAELRWWEPGMPAVASTPAADDETPLVEVSAVQRVCEGRDATLDDVRQFLKQCTPISVLRLAVGDQSTPPKLITFQFSLKGYDSLVDGTDALVKWVNAPTAAAVRKLIKARNLELSEAGDLDEIGPFTIAEGVDCVLDHDGGGVEGDLGATTVTP